MPQNQFRIRTIKAVIAVVAFYLTPALLLGGDPYLFVLLSACLFVVLARSTRTSGGGLNAVRQLWRSQCAIFASHFAEFHELLR